jgi:hypothetical protein
MSLGSLKAALELCKYWYCSRGVLGDVLYYFWGQDFWISHGNHSNIHCIPGIFRQKYEYRYPLDPSKQCYNRASIGVAAEGFWGVYDIIIRGKFFGYYMVTTPISIVSQRYFVRSMTIGTPWISQSSVRIV